MEFVSRGIGEENELLRETVTSGKLHREALLQTGLYPVRALGRPPPPPPFVVLFASTSSEPGVSVFFALWHGESRGFPVGKRENTLYVFRCIEGSPSQ